MFNLHPPLRASAAIVVVALAAAACGAAAASPTALVGAASAGPSAQASAAQPSAIATAGSGATPAPAASTTVPAPTRVDALPAGPCEVVTAADIEAAYGGSSSTGVVDGEACMFEVTGTMFAGKPDSPFLVRVGFVPQFTPFETIKATLGDAVTQVDGLGKPAWSALGILHVQVGGGSMQLAAGGVGTFDKPTLVAEGLALAKTILSRI